MKHSTWLTTLLAVFVGVGLQWGCGDDSGGGGGVQDAAIADSSTFEDAQGDAAPVESCVGTCKSCDSLASEEECGAVQGCSWSTEGSCSGTCTACNDLSLDQCEAAGCTEQSQFECGGTCTDCSQFDSATSCQEQDGCSWSGSCVATVRSCSALSDDPDACANEGGCSWTPGTCVGNGSCIGLREADCNSIRACEWSAWTGCSGSFRCSAVASDESSCGNLVVQGCSWTPGECTGTPECNHGTRRDCENTGLCAWFAGCSGTCSDCSTFTDESSCLSQDGCSAGGTATCGGDCTSCDTLSTSEDCGAQPGCQWNDSAACTGTCDDCDTFNDKADCNAQPGCQWQ